MNALRLVLAGGTYVPAAMIAERKASAPARGVPPGTPKSIAGLTPRQNDVLRLLIAGKPNKVICRELDLAEGTVKSHVAAILKALNASNRVEVVIAAGKLGVTP